MSGTEAVMAAVRLARFNTRKKLIMCFSGAYHGWWDGVQPGLGSERNLSDCLTLKDLHPASLDVIRWRAREIAGVLVNPVQAFHPNSPPPNDAVLLTSGMRKTARFDFSLCPVVAPIAGGVHGRRHPIDLRQGVFRLSPHARWGTGVFWGGG